MGEGRQHLVDISLHFTRLCIACLLILALEYTTDAVQAKQYCKTESFEAKCESDEVILIKQALFGRMQVGRCAKQDYGNIGCSKDVQGFVDSQCSGRHSCSFSISDPTLVRTEPCPSDFAAYLEADFDCVPVAASPQEWCSNANYIQLSEPSGYIASITTEETGCGSAQSPWIILAQPGQRINVTLYDFSLNLTSSNRAGMHDVSDGLISGSSPERSRYPVYCQQYARLEEKDAGRSTIVCGGDRRLKHVYTSVGHKVEIHVINRRMRSRSQYFLLHYEAVGCPIFKPPPDAYVRAEGSKIDVICNKTGEKYRLKCVGSVWEGDISNCSSVPAIRADEINKGVGLPPVGISVVIIVGVALVVVVYVAIMIICVMYLQRRKRRLRQAAHVEKMDTGELQLGDLQLLKPAESTDVLEERVPMLSKPVTLRPAVGCVAVGDYPDMHQIRTMLHSRAGNMNLVDQYAIGPLGGAREANSSHCDCMTTYGRVRPLAPPRLKDPIYEPAARLHKVQCPTVPNGVKPYCELDPKGLQSGSKLPNPDVLNNTLKDSKQLKTQPQTDTPNNDNATNSIREQTL